MPTRLIGWPAAILAMLITLTLVVGELTNAGQRRWWAGRPLTTDTVSGLLVLLFTILVVNQLLNRRQARQRGHAVAAQAAIMVAQATRSAKAVSSVTGGSGDRGAAVPGDRLGDAMQQLQDAAAPLLQLLHPAIRDSIQGIGRTAEE